MPDPGKAEEQRAITRQSLLENSILDPLAASVSTTEARLSGLPGRVNGPADAYRHIVWVGEMARRFGPDIGGSFAELHELQGAASESRRRLFDQPDLVNGEAARAMDRRNNLLGVSIGQRARSFQDVLRLARETIDRSPEDGSGGVAGAVWLPDIEWLVSPPRPWNWPNTDWSQVPRQHVENYERGYREINRRSAIERRAALAAERRGEWLRLLREDREREAAEGGGPVQVRAHQRDGHPVGAYTRSAPSR